MLSDQFTEIFRGEHRIVRDTLFQIQDAFAERDLPKIRELLQATAEYVGPHFRYEEESMYPSLVQIFGADYVESLLSHHDRVIGAAGRLIELSQQDSLSDADVEEGQRLVLGILPHVSDCDGLSIMVERLDEGEVQEILDTREKALAENLDLVEWSSTIRPRAAVVPV